MAHLRLDGSPPDALVVVDDLPVGTLATVARRGVALEVGPHRISVERNGYFPWDAEVTAGERMLRLHVRLAPVPD
jgi:hypothetical protein